MRDYWLFLAGIAAVGIGLAGRRLVRKGIGRLRTFVRAFWPH
jgi:hypothetical protein